MPEPKAFLQLEKEGYIKRKYKMARKKTKRKAVYKKNYRRKSVLGDITMGGVTAITGASLVGAVGKVI